MAGLLIITAFGSAFLLVFGINLLISDALAAHRLKIRKRLEREEQASFRHDRLQRFATRREQHQPEDETEDEPEQLTLAQKFVRMVDESGLHMQPAQVAMICGVLAVVSAGAVQFMFHRLIISVLAGAGAAFLPVLYVSHVRKKRLAKLLSQLPEAFDLMSRSMRAGQTITQAMQTVADDMSLPVAEEFGYCCDQQNLGLSAEATMRGLAKRTGILEIKIFVLAVMVHRQTGGNLSLLLDKLSSVIRERHRINGSMQALTAEGRAQMMVLLALPPVILGALMIINRPYTMILFEYPNLLIVTTITMTLGALAMNRIVSLDF